MLLSDREWHVRLAELKGRKLVVEVTHDRRVSRGPVVSDPFSEDDMTEFEDEFPEPETG